MLTALAGSSRIYRRQLEDALPMVERLSEDLDDVPTAMLLTSLATALAEPSRLGTPHHLEQHALAVLKNLR